MGLAYELSGGDLAGWVSQMNTLSQRIGTTNSTWTDACGLDSGNTTTAVDMYLILRYLMSFDAFKEISAAPTFYELERVCESIENLIYPAPDAPEE